MIIKYATGLFALSLFTLLALPARACELEYDKFGRLQGNCRLSDFFEKFDLDIEIDRSEPRYDLILPNLRIRRISYWTYSGNTTVDVYVDVENTGTKDIPGSFDVAVTATPVNPRTLGPAGPTQALSTTIAGLPAGARQRHLVGYAYVPDRDVDWDLSVVAVVDPPTSSQRLGDVWESNEQDNVKVDACRVFGKQTGDSSIQTPPCD